MWTSRSLWGAPIRPRSRPIPRSIYSCERGGFSDSVDLSTAPLGNEPGPPSRSSIDGIRKARWIWIKVRSDGACRLSEPSSRAIVLRVSPQRCANSVWLRSAASRQYLIHRARCPINRTSSDTSPKPIPTSKKVATTYCRAPLVSLHYCIVNGSDNAHQLSDFSDRLDLYAKLSNNCSSTVACRRTLNLCSPARATRV
jgi:hypothetical protein